MSLEGNEWVDDVQVWLVKKKNTNHFRAALDTTAEHLFLGCSASSHAPP